MMLEELKVNNIYRVKLLEDDDIWYISFKDYTDGRLLTNGTVCIDREGIVNFVNPLEGFLCFDDNIENIYETTAEEQKLYTNSIINTIYDFKRNSETWRTCCIFSRYSRSVIL